MCLPKSIRSGLLAVLAVGATYFGFRDTAEAAADVGTTTIEEVSQLVGAGGIHIYDANSAKQYASGHVPGAIHLTFDQVTVERLPKDKNARIIFYCWNTMCTSSHEAATKAAGLGYTNVLVMRDGINGWKKAGQKVEVPGAD